MSETKRRILDTARELFNAHGLHRVGVREIARATGMSPGNLGYHFATKDDLVEALVLELHELNQRTIFGPLPSAIGPAVLYRSAVATMRNILVYRFVVRSYVDAVMASPRLKAFAARQRATRRARHDALVDALAAGGHLRRAAVMARTDYLFEQSELISSGWLNAATLQGRRDDEAVVLYYAKVGLALLEPYCTPRGARELRRVLAGAYDDASAPAARARGRAGTRRGGRAGAAEAG